MRESFACPTVEEAHHRHRWLLRELPPIPGIEQLIIVVDNDPEGQDAAQHTCTMWRCADRKVIPLVPKTAGADANDVLRSVCHA